MEIQTAEKSNQAKEVYIIMDKDKIFVATSITGVSLILFLVIWSIATSHHPEINASQSQSQSQSQPLGIGKPIINMSIINESIGVPCKDDPGVLCYHDGYRQLNGPIPPPPSLLPPPPPPP
jgi:hypothetical protein